MLTRTPHTSDLRDDAAKPVQLLCVAQPAETDGWEALCLDFDIAVQGRSFDEAKAALQAAIVSYVDDARHEAEPARTKLLNRRAPLTVRLVWGWRLFMDTIRDRRDQEHVTVGFPVTCPV